MEYYKDLYLEIDSELEFGKHNCESVESILDEDPGYIRWLSDNGVEFSDEVIQKLETIND